MQLTSALLLAMWLGSAVAGQNFKNGSPAVDQVVQVMTFPYAGFKGHVYFLSTPPTPRANGRVKITRLSPTTIIDAHVDDLPPANSFCPCFSRYVLWLIAPDGELQNAGDFVMHGDSGELHTTTAWCQFGMIVTAEPNCPVEAPSELVVLLNEFSVPGIAEPGRFASIDYAPELSEECCCP
jgi:hypothetical protein